MTCWSYDYKGVFKGWSYIHIYVKFIELRAQIQISKYSYIRCIAERLNVIYYLSIVYTIDAWWSVD